MNEFFLKGGERKMLKEKNYCTVHKSFLILFVFIDRMIGYLQFSNMTRVYALYSSMTSKFYLCQVIGDEAKHAKNRRRLERKYVSLKEFVKLFSSLCTSGVYRVKFHLLDH